MPPTAGSRVLLVIEDDDDIRELLAAHARAAGWQVRTAATGAEGYAAALADPPSVVSVDFLLPDIDGRQILRGLRGDARTQACGILINTVLDLEDYLEVILKLHIEGVLPKPFTRGEVATLLEHVERRVADRLAGNP